jgi:Zn-dependent peptidase ImmA (M78 family)
MPQTKTTGIQQATIEQITDSLLKAAGIAEPPVDPSRVARHLGVRVQKTDLGSDCSAALVRKGDTAVIGVHWAHAANRQRFSIAHELGHFQLHTGGTYVDKDIVVRFRNDRSGSGTDGEERDANRFAAALLMPAKWLRDAIEHQSFAFGDDSSLAELASHFEVSTQAMSFRLADLKLLQL